MVKKRIKYYRGWFAVTSVFCLVLLTGIFAKFWFYFNSGADRSTALNVPPTLPESHVPSVTWLPDDSVTGRKMEDFNRQQIMKDYIRCWYQLHLSYLNGTATGLKDYFTPSALPKALQTVQSVSNTMQLHETDLKHNIQLHFYSADGQIVSFTDKQLLLKQRLYKKDGSEKIFSGEITADYDVVMLLEDGYWRIKNILKKEPSPLPPTDTVDINKAGLVQVKGKQFYCNDTLFFPKGINYYPQKTPWSLFWSRYDSLVIRKDFALVKSLGFNSLRVFVNFHDFNKGNVPPERLAQLGNLLDNAARVQLKVIVTLFDFAGDYRLLNLTATDRQLETILKAFRRHPAVLAWDIKNEPDLDFKHHDKEDVTEWLTWTLKRARAYDPNHLITIGWAFPENADFLSHSLDFVSFHSYKEPAELATNIDSLQQRVNNKPLVLEEFGMSTYRGLWSPAGNNEEDQAAYFTKVKQVLHQKGDIPLFVWTLYDFKEVPANVTGSMPWRRNPQKNFGIVTVDGRVKPGAKEL
ncbi:cellulase family glycosylhydrolase [Foetidibacter luteolus]|uniref:cellulase family glycosylhydrolase n=1 Tax=Foetidibacter luteolus TaxID=2608880 RepID=UPI00129A476A|nr:cellulase family glycosylhydrolase [Foetidibacter luteolus]